MTGLLADVNCEGHVDRLIAVLTSPEWIELWTSFNVRVETFASLGLDREMNDRAIWELCQIEGLFLLTRNRNAEGPDSLEASIRDGSADALPVLTLADADYILASPSYARTVSLDLLDIVHEMRFLSEAILGSGRLYLPRKRRCD